MAGLGTIDGDTPGMKVQPRSDHYIIYTLAIFDRGVPRI